MSSSTKMGTDTKSNDVNAKSKYTYKRKFFARRQVRTGISASNVIAKVLEVVQPKSVVDVGCGTGEFLAAFRECGIEDITGIDGEYVQRNLLAFPQKDFVSFDLNQPFTLERTYDLAICLEVAEHLNAERAGNFIDSLTRLAPIILFSAAIPYQGGTHHVNEQWPEYWAKLFKLHGFVPVDAVRRSIWNDRKISTCYRQNILFFCTEKSLTSNEKLYQAYKATNPDALAVVHPDIYLECNMLVLRILRRILTPILEPLWRLNEKNWNKGFHVDTAVVHK